MKFNGIDIEFDDPEERKQWGVFIPDPVGFICESTANGFGEFEEWFAKQPKSDWWTVADTEKRREYMRNYMRERYRRRKTKIIAMMGGKCSACQATESLEIHHKNPAEKDFDPGSRERRWESVLAELEKCELLCEPCHFAKHATTHGQLAMYKVHGCRCDACVARYKTFKKAADQRFYKATKDDPVRWAARQQSDRERYERKKLWKASSEAGFV